MQITMFQCVRNSVGREFIKQCSNEPNRKSTPPANFVASLPNLVIDQLATIWSDRRVYLMFLW